MEITNRPWRTRYYRVTFAVVSGSGATRLSQKYVVTLEEKNKKTAYAAALEKLKNTLSADAQSNLRWIRTEEV